MKGRDKVRNNLRQPPEEARTNRQNPAHLGRGKRPPRKIIRTRIRDRREEEFRNGETLVIKAPRKGIRPSRVSAELTGQNSPP